MMSVMDKENIIIENRRRLGDISAVYDPITGEGSTSIERERIEIEGFPITEMKLPASMLDDESVARLIAGGAERYLREVKGVEANDKNIISLWLEFCLKRIKHDFEYWARTMTTIADKGKGRIPWTTPWLFSGSWDIGGPSAEAGPSVWSGSSSHCLRCAWDCCFSGT